MTKFTEAHLHMPKLSHYHGMGNSDISGDFQLILFHFTAHENQLLL